MVQAERQRAWYVRNREEIISRSKARNKEIIARNIVFVEEYLSTHPCVDCGEDDIVVLEFDHLGKEPKKATISQLKFNNYSIETIIKEIEKCEVVCANCHRRRHYVRRGAA